MGDRDRLHDRQAQPGTALGPAPAAVRPAEPLERVRQELLREPRPGISHLDGQVAAARPRRQADGAARRGGPQRVVDEVVHGLPDLVRVDQRDQRGGSVYPALHPGGAGRASRSRSLVILVSLATSASALATARASCSRVRPGRLASSSSAPSTASGVRSSWLAAAVKPRCRASASCRLASRLFMVPASAASSSRVRGTRTPSAASRSDSAATSRRIRSTGDSAAAASQYAPAPARRTNAAPPATSAVVSARTVSLTDSSETPATATHPGLAFSGAATIRTVSSSSVLVTATGPDRAAASCPGVTSGTRPASWPAYLTTPDGSMTWTRVSPDPGLKAVPPCRVPEADARYCPAPARVAVSVASVVRSSWARSWDRNSHAPIANATARAAVNTAATRSLIDTRHPAAGSRSRYPMPRTVSMSWRPNGASILRRR